MNLVKQHGSTAHLLETEGYGLEHLPYASFTRRPTGRPTLGVRLGDHVFAVDDLVRQAHLSISPASDQLISSVRDAPNLDRLLAAGRPVWSQLRHLLTAILGDAISARAVVAHAYPVADVDLGMPFTVADYVDFYASEHHASNVGSIFRPGQPALTPNWKHLPIGYHGRAGTVVPSGTPIVRPKGLRQERDSAITFGASRLLDVEAEVGFVLGGSAPHGEIPLAHAADHIFGVTIVNDWSARDIQAFEYVPLGPFLGKSFATSIGNWVTPLAALDSARVPPPPREIPLAEYLDDSHSSDWGFDLRLHIWVDSVPVSSPPFATMYFTAAQMLTHLSANGASVRPGDFFASGTVSGPEKHERGSFLELSWNGSEPLTLPNGVTMSFLEDGQSIVINATAPGADGRSIEIGPVEGTVVPAR